jgi:hypothetical protein
MFSAVVLAKPQSKPNKINTNNDDAPLLQRDRRLSMVAVDAAPILFSPADCVKAEAYASAIRYAQGFLNDERS